MDFATCYFFFFIFFFFWSLHPPPKLPDTLILPEVKMHEVAGRGMRECMTETSKPPSPIDFFWGYNHIAACRIDYKAWPSLKMMIFVLFCFLNLFFSSMAYWVTLQAILLSHVGACRCYWTGYNVDLILSPFCHWSNAVLCIFLLNEGYEMSRSLNSIAGISGKAIGLSSVSAPYSSPSPVRRSWSPIPSIL